MVLDTTRMDAVSAYGFARGTTPSFDALAREGLLYRWALAPAPWTPPSHATLFTSVGPDQHGVGIDGRMVLGRDFPTIAERLSDAGYETVGFSENPIVGNQLGLARGFAHFEGESNAVGARAAIPDARFDVVLGVERWAKQRVDPTRPFFVFVNLFDPHDPYAMHEEYIHLAPGDLAEAQRIARKQAARGIAEAEGMCSQLPGDRELATLRALYLGEVSAADAKLGRIRAALESAAPGSLIAAVTADHGEHLGEHRLLGHEFSLHAEVLHVPLVVHGLANTPPAVIETPVALGDIAPSLLSWLGVDVPAAWSSGRLPRAAENAAEGRPLRAVFSDVPLVAPAGWRTDHKRQAIRRRRACGEEDRVFGEILSLVRFPYKLVWYERHPAQLYDLRWDPRELSDLSQHESERTAAMTNEIESWHSHFTAGGPVQAPLAPETLETLRSLGYVE